MFLLCRGQLIYAGMGQAVDIQHMPIHKAMNLYRVKDKVGCFEKVLMLAREMLAEATD